MYLGLKMTQNVRNKVLRGQQTTSKVSVMFLDAKIFKERYNQ